MAIPVYLNFPGATVDQYDATVKVIGHGPTGTPHVGGALFHVAMVTSDGVRVIDVWDSREQFESFSQDKIVPALQQTGMPAPEIQFIDDGRSSIPAETLGPVSRDGADHPVWRDSANAKVTLFTNIHTAVRPDSNPGGVAQLRLSGGDAIAVVRTGTPGPMPPSARNSTG